MTNKICPNCAVELDRGITNCPLCGDKKVDEGSGYAKGKANYPSEILHMETRARRRYTWELMGITTASAILISLIVDLVVSTGLAWSLYATTLFAGAWIYTTIFTFSRGRIWILVPSLLLNTLTIQLMVDMIKLPITWFVPLSLPITGLFFVLLFFIILLARRANYKGFNILAIVIIGASIQCVVFELFLDLYLNGSVSIDWSAITASAVVPFSAILMFIHYRLKRGLNLKSYFHV
jgi:hypothetical protein